MRHKIKYLRNKKLKLRIITYCFIYVLSHFIILKTTLQKSTLTIGARALALASPEKEPTYNKKIKD
jgi:hypothetical protein